MHHRLLDTWHQSAASVYTATPVVLAARGVMTIQINMVPLTLTTGEYGTGKVVSRTGTPGITPITGPGTPAEVVTVVLKQNGQIVANTSTGAEGFDLRLFPNPTTGEVNIDLTRNDLRETEASVTTIRGDVVYRKIFNAGEKINFTLSQQASGIYMVRVVAEDQLTIHKLVLDRR